MDGYWSYWHGSGYSGVGPPSARRLSPERPGSPTRLRLREPDRRSRVAGALRRVVYVPNGGKDFPAKMRFLEALDGTSRSLTRRGAPLVLCGDLNVARTDMDVHPKERNRNRAAPGRARAARTHPRGLVDVGRALDPDNAELFTWWPPWRNMRQRNIGWRLDYVLASAPLALEAPGAARCSPTWERATMRRSSPNLVEGRCQVPDTFAPTSPASGLRCGRTSRCRLR